MQLKMPGLDIGQRRCKRGVKAQGGHLPSSISSITSRCSRDIGPPTRTAPITVTMHGSRSPTSVWNPRARLTDGEAVDVGDGPPPQP